MVYLPLKDGLPPDGRSPFLREEPFRCGWFPAVCFFILLPVLSRPVRSRSPSGVVPEDLHCDFVLRCKGGGIIGARIYDGIVYIRMQPDVEDHEIAAVIVGEEAVTLKRVCRDGGHLVLMAENPAFPPIVVNGGHTARILGKAVGFTSVIK